MTNTPINNQQHGCKQLYTSKASRSLASHHSAPSEAERSTSERMVTRRGSVSTRLPMGAALGRSMPWSEHNTTRASLPALGRSMPWSEHNTTRASLPAQE